MICRYEFGVLVRCLDKDAYLSGYGVVNVARLSDGKIMTVNVRELTPELPPAEADTPRQLYRHKISTRKRKGVNKRMNDITILLKFPPEVADKIQNFTRGGGVTEWNQVLATFDRVLGATPTYIEIKGATGSPTLPNKVHAGAAA